MKKIFIIIILLFLGYVYAQNKININKPEILKDQSLVNPNDNRGCEDGYIDDCSGDGDCCPESWIGDGFADCEDQEWDCDLTCYDNDGGDCDGGTTGGSDICDDCEFDYTAHGSECCDTAWDEYGINCADLEANYSWDCSGCNCPGDGDPVCGDGWCTGDETYETCPEDCNAPGECDNGLVEDCADDDCCPESWIGDGLADCEDQEWGCDLSCYSGEWECEGSTNGGTSGGDEACNDCAFDFSNYGSECCDTAWDEYGLSCSELEANYDWNCDGCNCPGCQAQTGDANGDFEWNVLDITIIAACILQGNCSSSEFACALDVNGNNEITVIDIILIANCILQGNCNELPD